MEADSGADSVSSTPRSFHNSEDSKGVVRVMCSFGGKILPRPHDNELRYTGGDTRIVAIHRPSATFSAVLSKLSSLLPPPFTVKYQLPNEDLDSLITLSCDEDLLNMFDELDRLPDSPTTHRLRLFLFPVTTTATATPTHRHDDIMTSKERESWFLDTLNNNNSNSSLERVRSEVSSVVSDMPDYLFGLDSTNNNLEDPVKGVKNRVGSGSGMGDPGSPRPNLPPVRTRPDDDNRVEDPRGGGVGVVWGRGGQVGSNPGSPYTGQQQPVQPVPVYYVPTGLGPGALQGGFVPVQVPVSVPGANQGQYVVQPYGAVPGQGPVGFPGVTVQGNPVQGSGIGFPGMPGQVYEMPVQGSAVQGSGLGYPGSAGQVYEMPVQGSAVQGSGQVPFGFAGSTGQVYEVPMQGNMVQGSGQVQVQVPVGYRGAGQVYETGMMQGNNVGSGQGGPGQPVYYGVSSAGTGTTGVVGGYPGMVVPMTSGDSTGSGPDVNKERIPQG